MKSTMRYHYTPVRMADIKKMTTPNIGEAVGSVDAHTVSAGRNVKWHRHCGKQIVFQL